MTVEVRKDYFFLVAATPADRQADEDFVLLPVFTLLVRQATTPHFRIHLVIGKMCFLSHASLHTQNQPRNKGKFSTFLVCSHLKTYNPLVAGVVVVVVIIMITDYVPALPMLQLHE